jgi:ABC-type branched-subunit amino acid transport system substrate-binding protein
MSMMRVRWLAVALVVALGAVACGNDRKASTTSTAGGGNVTTSTAPAGPTFGDAPLPCGPAKAGETNTASDTGVTADTITIGAGDDRGYAQTPGLNKEMTEAIQAVAALCNKAGGINGRQIQVKTYDAAILAIQKAMTQACSDNLFFLVGEGFALDSNQEEVRLGCKLPAVPGYSVSSAFANAPLMYEPVPNPADQETSEAAVELARLQPDSITAAATLVGNFSATQETRDKVLAAYPKFGFKFLANGKIEYSILGESDWTPFIKRLKDAGAKFVYWSGECTNLLKAMQAAKLNNYTAVWQTETNHYETKCADSNTDGAMNGLYIRMAFIPFEEASTDKAVQDYLKMIQDAGTKPTQLGMQSTSAFLLWATAAQSCGAQLTRQCVLDDLKNVHKWTGHGLHAPADPGGNNAPNCAVLLQLEGTKYVRVSPTKAGTYDCDPNSVVTVDTKGVQAAKLDTNRIAQEFNK